MSKFVILRDLRLSGTFNGVLRSNQSTPVDNPHPDIAKVTVSGSVSMSQMFDHIQTAIGGNSVSGRTLFILCHGFAGSSAVRGQSGDFGGQGLQLSSENVLHSNVSRLASLQNVFQNIVIYACGAGDTQDGAEGTTADGRYLMGAIAIHTGANVYAADRIQWYSGAGFNFGAWEGQLFRFPPDGGDPVAVDREPISLATVAAQAT